MKILILTFFAIVTLSIAGNAQVAVIANKNVPVEEVKDIQLLDYYAGDIRTWADGTPIKVFDLKPKGEVRDLFFHFLGKTSSRMKSIWMKKCSPAKAIRRKRWHPKQICSNVFRRQPAQLVLSVTISLTIP